MSMMAKDELLKSASDAQRANGKVPTVVDNEKFITTILEQNDRRAADAKPIKRDEPVDDRKDRRHKEAVKRAQRAGFSLTPGWELSSSPRVPLALGGSALEVKKMGKLEKRMRARLRLLRSKPDWANRLKRINPLALQGQLGHEKHLEAVEEVKKVIRASNVTFGHWMKDRPVKLYSFPSG